ncbi:MAG: Ig-like domain-containing protein [Aggregatilineales bacterium]
MPRLDALDRGVLVAVVSLLLALIGVIVRGDQAGVLVTASIPERISVTAALSLTFSEPMDAQSVESRLHFAPKTDVRLTWSGATLNIVPLQAWLPETPYTLRLDAGARSQSGRLLLAPLEWAFVPRPPRVVYLAPAYSADSLQATNLWLVAPEQPFAARQLTYSSLNLESFQPSPDGAWLVYAQPRQDGTADLYLLEIERGETRQLTNCTPVLARCAAPDWSPEGTRLIYERTELDPALDWYDRDVPRAWLLNLRDLATAPLLSDTSRLGGTPKWSPDGRQIAAYDRNIGAIAIYDLATGARKLIETLDDVGDYAFHPRDGRFVYAQLIQIVGRFSSALEMVDLNDPSRGIWRLSGEGIAVEDRQPRWTPDGSRLIFTRRILDGSGIPSAQIYALEPVTGRVMPILVDENYFHGAISLDPTGRYLLMQRVPVAAAQPVPSIWVLDLTTGELWQIAENGFLPRWLP